VGDIGDDDDGVVGVGDGDDCGYLFELIVTNSRVIHKPDTELRLPAGSRNQA
jgi:hypothetical protein